MSSLTKTDNLIHGKRYFVDVWWNLHNTIREKQPYQFIGIFRRTNYVPAKKYINPHGLVHIIRPARTEVIFNILDHLGQEQPQELKVSSMNSFYSSYRPKSLELCRRKAIMRLRLPSDLKWYLRKFVDPSTYFLRISKKYKLIQKIQIEPVSYQK